MRSIPSVRIGCQRFFENIYCPATTSGLIDKLSGLLQISRYRPRTSGGGATADPKQADRLSGQAEF